MNFSQTTEQSSVEEDIRINVQTGPEETIKVAEVQSFAESAA
jgi:hypothetical protein